MSSSRKNQGRGKALHFDRFRSTVAEYAEGVHRLGEAVAAKDRVDLPDPELAAFYASWDGAELFIDAYVIRPMGGLEREGEVLWFADSALGDHFGIDLESSRIIRLEEDTGELLVEATSFAHFVEALIVAEGEYHDHEGDFVDGVFGDDGELSAKAQVKREERALKIDPAAPAPAWRLARALERVGDREEAREVLEKLVEREPEFAWAWFDLGRLRRADDWLAGAQEAFEKAAETGAKAEHEQAGWFCAHAARVAAENKDEPARARLAARALELDPEVARAQRRAAQDRVDEEQLDEARELVALAAALLPRDLEVAELRRRLARK